MGINAFTLGMRSVNPRAEVRVVWTSAWSDPGKEREAALALIAQGADMLTHDTDSSAVNQAAEVKGVKVFCYNSDELHYGPHAQLTGTVHSWGDFYIKTVNEVLAHKWKAENVWGGLKQGMVRMAPVSAEVPKSVQALIGKLQAQIVSGAKHPFTGPLVDQNGKVRLAAGQVLADSELEQMDYFVQGVSSRMPGK